MLGKGAELLDFTLSVNLFTDAVVVFRVRDSVETIHVRRRLDFTSLQSLADSVDVVFFPCSTFAPVKFVEVKREA